MTICLSVPQPTPPVYAVIVALLAADASGVMMVAGGVPSESADVVAAGCWAAIVCSCFVLVSLEHQ